MIGPLHEHFDSIFGTSTGAIIAALIALGSPMKDIHALYEKHVPKVMQEEKPSDKSKALAQLATEVLGIANSTS